MPVLSLLFSLLFMSYFASETRSFYPERVSESITDMNGAWTLVSKNHEAFAEGKMIKIVSAGTFVYTAFDPADGKFIGTEGGSYRIEAGKLLETLEFCTWTQDNVGKTYVFEFSANDEALTMSGVIDGEPVVEIWQRIDHGISDAPLAGAWRISSRVADGNSSSIELAPRRTIKILSGTRFQWTAYNMATKEFFGCGGGTYSAVDGIYTEHIEFFSRDQSRVGMALSFGFNRDGNDWRHTGKSSRGEPIDETWTIYDID